MLRALYQFELAAVRIHRWRDDILLLIESVFNGGFWQTVDWLWLPIDFRVRLDQSRLLVRRNRKPPPTMASCGAALPAGGPDDLAAGSFAINF